MQVVGRSPEPERVLRDARRDDDDRYRVPQLRELISSIDDDLQRMILPIALAEGSEAALQWQRRLASVREREAKLIHGDQLSTEALGWLTSADPSRDGPHRLCMDLHKAVDAVQARVATEALDGARTFGLTDADRALVRAFMRGVRRTQGLRFGHPGLGTTATRPTRPGGERPPR